MKIYLVGGAVRDELLGRPCNDQDWVVVGARPEQLLAAGYKQVGKDFPVFLEPNTKDEYALARLERKTGEGHTGFAMDYSPKVTLAEDLSRRDLTINSIAQSEDGETIVDPNNGQEDIFRRVLRHVGPAFSEDPLRVLRVARQKAQLSNWNFTVAEETMDLMREMATGGQLEELPAERVWAETKKALESTNPRAYFECLRECGGLAFWFPELDKLWGVPQRKEHHPEVDTGVHTMMVLDQVTKMTDDPRVRYMALVHDLGKGLTPEEEWPRHIDHEKKGVPEVERFSKRLKAPAEYRELGMLNSLLHQRVHRALDMRPKKILKTLKLMDAFRHPERVDMVATACQADARGRLGLEGRAYPQADYLRQAFALMQTVTIKDIDISGMKGPEIGVALDSARCEAMSGLWQEKEARKEAKQDRQTEAKRLSNMEI